METITFNYVTETCISCGTTFGMHPTHHQFVKNTKQSFYCPNGHSMAYQKSRVDILQEQVASKDRLIAVKDAEIARLSKSKRGRPKKV